MNNYITYGYCLVDGDMRLDSGQSEAVHLIFDAYDGGASIKKIAGMLKDKKVPSPVGNRPGHQPLSEKSCVTRTIWEWNRTRE